ncbi:acetoacetate--CoA ligase, partial [Paraburkholderia sp. SIMBA_055]
AVLDRFRQIAPKVMIAVDGYRYGGKEFDRRPVLRTLLEQLPSVEHVIVVPTLRCEDDCDGLSNVVTWAEAISQDATPLGVEHVP